MSLHIQELVYQFEVGHGARVFKVIFVLIVMLACAGLYDAMVYRNFAQREAMDMAQLGRNLAEGKGYTTLFVRPLSIFLLRAHRADQSALLMTDHPDIANPPVYPWLLAGLFKLMPERSYLTPPKGFTVYKPDLAVALLNQALFLLAGVLLFFLTERLFDSTRAWATAVIFAGTEMLWRFSVSGLNTLLLIVIFLGVAWCLVLLEKWMRFARTDPWLIGLAGVTGALVGVGGLTRYAFAWLIVPVVVYFLSFFATKRVVLALAAVSGLLVVMGPWVARNSIVSGMPFGTATFAICQGTPQFAEDRLERSLHPDLGAIGVKDYGRKLVQNGREIFQDLPKLGGSWVTPFFIVGLLVPFRNSGAARLRWFLVFGLVVFAIVQALGRTSVSAESPDINSDNLLVLLVPLVFMFGVALFFQLIESIALSFRAARLALMVAFCAGASLPLVHELLPPHPSPVVYPPYYPPLQQQVAVWFNSDELLMSDMPWALAWYGRRQTVWMTLNWKNDFFEITDYYKSIKGLYLGTLTTDTKFYSNWIRGQNNGWTTFLLESMIQGSVPRGFPLRQAPEGWFPELILLTDYDRWKLKPQ